MSAGIHCVDLARSAAFGTDDRDASDVPGLRWLINAPRRAPCAIDEDGWPAKFRVPDPRVYAPHKAWLASRSDREPVKKPRDLAQAKAVASMVVEHMPHYESRWKYQCGVRHHPRISTHAIGSRHQRMTPAIAWHS